MSNVTVIILCGGKGTRLAPVIGSDTPKCLAPINGTPFLTHLVRRYTSFGAKDFILCAGHLADQVEHWAAQAHRFPPGVNFRLSIDDGKGPMVAAYRAKSMARTYRILIVNGDTFFEGDLGDIIAETDFDACLELKTHGRSTGMYLLPKDFLGPLYTDFISAELTIPFSILDIGTPEGYARAQEILK